MQDGQGALFFDVGLRTGFQVVLVVKKKKKKFACQWRRYKRHRFDPWVRNIPWRRACNPLQYICVENPHRQRGLGGYSP